MALSGVSLATQRCAASQLPLPIFFTRPEGHRALRQGGLRPHNFCLPILKREVHREAVLAAATSGHPRFFLGTDSAPHARSTKVLFYFLSKVLDKRM